MLGFFLLGYITRHTKYTARKELFTSLPLGKTQTCTALTVSPGWSKTCASIRMMERIAQSGNISLDAATQSVMDALGGIPIGRPAEPAQNISSMEEPSLQYNTSKSKWPKA